MLLSSNRFARFSFSRWLSLSAAEGYECMSWRARLSNLSSNLVAVDISSLVALGCQVMLVQVRRYEKGLAGMIYIRAIFTLHSYLFRFLPPFSEFITVLYLGSRWGGEYCPAVSNLGGGERRPLLTCIVVVVLAFLSSFSFLSAALFVARISCGNGILSHSKLHTTFSLNASVMILLSSTSTSALASGGQSSKVRATYCFSLSGKVVFCAGCDGTGACVCVCVDCSRLRSVNDLIYSS